MAGNDEQRDSAVASSAGDPGPLSRLLQELADAPGEDLLAAWQNELKPGDRLDRFEIRRAVGRGGFGVVYEAFDQELGREVAIKTLRPGRARHDFTSGWIKKEAEAVAKLSHAGIVTLFDVCNCASGPYLVMELLRGETLAQRIAQGPLPVNEALRIAEEIAKGLAHAHQRGVLHRDLKPANVFLCEDGRVKLLDFGLAHLLGTGGASGAGTPAYMAPEQARGGEVDQRADVYSAGRMLGEMLGERRPRRLERAVALATSADPSARPRDGQAWFELLQSARRAVERPAQVRRVTLLAGLGVLVGGVAVGVAVHRTSRPPDVLQGHGKPSIGVLPFADLSPGKDQEYFSDGVAEEILTALSKVPGLWVPGRTSSFHFKGKNAGLEEIGRELKVEHILEGSVRRSGNRVRISAEVVKASNGERLWSQSFDRELTDVISVQDEIARAVVEALRVKLLASQGTKAKEHRPASQEAYASYLLGKHFVQNSSADSQRRAIAALERAVDLDPAYVSAWAALAESRRTASLVGVIPWAEARRQSLVAANRAVELGPDSPVSLAARAVARMSEWDWPGAKADLDRAVELGPDDPQVVGAMASYLVRTGRVQEALPLLRRIVEVEPLDGRAWVTLGAVSWWSGYFDDAYRAFARALEVDPQNTFPPNNRGIALVMAGRPDEGLASCRKGTGPGSLLCLACAYHALGDDAQSQKALDALLADPRGDSLYYIARVYGFRNQKDQAFDWLERAREEHVRALVDVAGDPLLRSLRTDPRYSALLRKMNLPVD